MSTFAKQQEHRLKANSPRLARPVLGRKGSRGLRVPLREAKAPAMLRVIRPQALLSFFSFLFLFFHHSDLELLGQVRE